MQWWYNCNLLQKKFFVPDPFWEGGGRHRKQTSSLFPSCTDECLILFVLNHKIEKRKDFSNPVTFILCNVSLTFFLTFFFAAFECNLSYIAFLSDFFTREICLGKMNNPP